MNFNTLDNSQFIACLSHTVTEASAFILIDANTGNIIRNYYLKYEGSSSFRITLGFKGVLL